MIPELGHLALILAFLLAIVQGTLPIVGAARRIPAWMALARPVARGQFLFIAAAWLCLAYSFVTSDFSVLNVATNSNSQLPIQYRFAATWGSHEGSMMLWVFMLSAGRWPSRSRAGTCPTRWSPACIGVMGLVSVGFLLFMLTTSNPFERVFPVPADGRDLNPLLQDPGMVMHPPMLYMGYVGFSIAFSFAIAALLGGRLDTTWARWSRPWTTLAWSFLTIGIMIGSWWAYYTLGWGGWWFWDPVENASFMPWLVGTALLHSLAVTEKRGTFRNWTVLLAICAFSLSLIGTFLVRSGVLTSVHAFATDPRRGVFILAFLVLVIGGSLVLYALRAPKVGVGARFDLVSREMALLANNVLLIAAAGSVLLGHALPALPRRAQSRQALGRPAVFRLGVRAVDDPAHLPDGRWTACALEAGIDSRSRTASSLGARCEPRDSAAGAVRRRTSGSPASRSAWRSRSGSSPRRSSAFASGFAACRAAGCRPRRATAAAAAQLLGHGRRAPRHRGVRRSASRWSRATRPSATSRWTSAIR